VQQALGTAPTATQLAQSVAFLDHLIEEVHRIAMDLRSPLLDDLGLVPALRGFLVETAKQSGLEISFKAPAKVPRFDADIETACFRVVQEAVTNILRHAHARSVWVEVSHTETVITAAVRDDGAGFDVEAARRRARQGTALGLLGMQERAALLGGKLTIRSAPKEGTEVRVTIPSIREGETQ
jgi:signal transduction histidine kinase